MELHEILKAAHELGASDIHLVAGHPPAARVHTVVQSIPNAPKLTAEDVRSFVQGMASKEALARFEEIKDADFSFAAEGLGRYRVNAHQQRNSVAIAMRTVKTKVPPLAKLTLPEVITKLTYLPRGLVLVTGDTGSGKSTTLAAMIQAMNEREAKHIITLEDPIEYTFKSEKCLIEQRELGADMPSFASALKHALRQDPDIILVGEMRDLETTALAITAAETGHLVLSTLHTSSAAQTVDRIIDMYPGGQQNQIRSMLSNTLQAVISQTLFPRLDQAGMVPGVEILLATPAVRNLIREARTFEIPNVIETSRAMGMQTLDHCISQLFFNGMISREDAIGASAHPDRLSKRLAA
ncbi:MAG: type IV pili twitching motility protein PilT [Planctomyces sp.]|nr:type IV pili twitching motility protein PilT [Planctomyces sp.]MBA4119570.1 type IV pili twitching motility protein PilT [Isosphaera sp.]